MYDVCWIRAVTGMKMKGKIVDTMIAASVIDENRFKYSLDALSKDYLNEDIQIRFTTKNIRMVWRYS